MPEGDAPPVQPAPPPPAVRPRGAARGARLRALPAGLLRRLRGPAGVALAVDVALAVLLFHTAWASPRTSWAGGCCDAEQSMWFLGWAPYWVSHLSDPFVTHLMNAPDAVNLMWNSSFPLPALLMAPVTALLGPVFAYNLLLTLGVALSAWTATLLLRRHTGRPVAALVGGLVYGFSPYLLGQAMGHVQLVVVLTAPLVVMLVEDLVASARDPRRLGVALGLLVVAQLLTSLEVLAGEGLLAAILLLALVPGDRSAVSRGILRLRLALAPFVAVVAVLGAVPLGVFLAGPARPTSPPQAPDVFVTDLVNLVVPTDTQWWSPDAAQQASAHFTGLGLENTGYIGLPLLLALGIIAGRLWRRVDVRVAAVVAAVALVLSLGPTLHVAGTPGAMRLPWGAIAHLPFMDAALPGRLSMETDLAVALLVAVGLDTALGHVRRARGRAVAAALGVALLPWLPRPDFPSTTAVLPALFTHWDDAHVPDGDTVLVAPFIRDGGQADPMLWQAAAGDRFAMPQGYFYIPDAQGRPQYGAIASTLSTFMEEIQEKGIVIRVLGPALQAVDRDLRDRRVTTVVVGPMSHRGEMVSFFTLLFGRTPEEIDGCEVWHHVDTRGVQLGAA